jgi:hypothetical protein
MAGSIDNSGASRFPTLNRVRAMTGLPPIEDPYNPPPRLDYDNESEAQGNDPPD